MPGFMTKKLFRSLERLGEIYEQTRSFDKAIVESLKKPYELTGFNLKKMNFAMNIGLGKIMWHKFLKENGAFDKKLDKPFI